MMENTGNEDKVILLLRHLFIELIECGVRGALGGKVQTFSGNIATLDFGIREIEF